MKKNPSNTTEASTVKQKKQWTKPEMVEFDIQTGGLPDAEEITAFYGTTS